MRFFGEMVERDFETVNENSPYNFRQYKPIRINDDLWFSIQASYGHYCIPRETLDDLNTYTHWEIALFNDDGFVTVTDVLPDFPSLAEIEYYEQTVYAYVPTDLVEELYLALK